MPTSVKTQDMTTSAQLVGIQQLQSESFEPERDGIRADAQAPLQEQPGCCRIVVVLKLESSSMAPQARLCWVKLQRSCEDLCIQASKLNDRTGAIAR